MIKHSGLQESGAVPGELDKVQVDDPPEKVATKSIGPPSADITTPVKV